MERPSGIPESELGSFGVGPLSTGFYKLWTSLERKRSVRYRHTSGHRGSPGIGPLPIRLESPAPHWNGNGKSITSVPQSLVLNWSSPGMDPLSTGFCKPCPPLERKWSVHYRHTLDLGVLLVWVHSLRGRTRPALHCNELCNFDHGHTSVLSVELEFSWYGFTAYKPCPSLERKWSVHHAQYGDRSGCDLLSTRGSVEPSSPACVGVPSRWRRIRLGHGQRGDVRDGRVRRDELRPVLAVHDRRRRRTTVAAVGTTRRR